MRMHPTRRCPGSRESVGGRRYGHPNVRVTTGWPVRQLAGLRADVDQGRLLAALLRSGRLPGQRAERRHLEPAGFHRRARRRQRPQHSHRAPTQQPAAQDPRVHDTLTQAQRTLAVTPVPAAVTRRGPDSPSSRPSVHRLLVLWPQDRCLREAGSRCPARRSLFGCPRSVVWLSHGCAGRALLCRERLMMGCLARSSAALPARQPVSGSSREDSHDRCDHRYGSAQAVGHDRGDGSPASTAYAEEEGMIEHSPAVHERRPVLSG